MPTNKNILQISPEELRAHFLKRCDLQLPLIFSFDCDRTLVDRKRGSHFISEPIIEAFRKLKKHPSIIPLINTGRDCDSYKPIQDQIDHTDPCLFLAGRVCRFSNQQTTFPEALLPEDVLLTILKKIETGEVRFIDVKCETGNYFISLDHKKNSQFYALFKPSDWLSTIPYKEMTPDAAPPNIVRIEIPFFKSDNPELFDAIRNLPEAANALFETHASNLQWIPLRIHSSFAAHRDEVAFLRLVINSSLTNKGIGLERVAHHLSIPHQNLICFGDSADHTASDAQISHEIPKATLLISSEGCKEALKCATFTIPNIATNGLSNALDKILRAIF